MAGRAPGIMNTDQGCQFTGEAWTGALQEHGVAVSMDGRGRWMDNVFIQRLWRSLKYEEVYLWSHGTLPELETGTARWMDFYNHRRRHQPRKENGNSIKQSKHLIFNDFSLLLDESFG